MNCTETFWRGAGSLAEPCAFFRRGRPADSPSADRLRSRPQRAEARRRSASSSLTEAGELAAPQAHDLIEIDEALTRLQTLDARAASVVELRFFGGLTETESAEALGISLATLKRDWDFARAWLSTQLEWLRFDTSDLAHLQIEPEWCRNQGMRSYVELYVGCKTNWQEFPYSPGPSHQFFRSPSRWIKEHCSMRKVTVPCPCSHLPLG